MRCRSLRPRTGRGPSPGYARTRCQAGACAGSREICAAGLLPFYITAFSASGPAEAEG